MHHAHTFYVCPIITMKEFEAFNLKVGIGYGACQRRCLGGTGGRQGRGEVKQSFSIKIILKTKLSKKGMILKCNKQCLKYHNSS